MKGVDRDEWIRAVGAFLSGYFSADLADMSPDEELDLCRDAARFIYDRYLGA